MKWFFVVSLILRRYDFEFLKVVELLYVEGKISIKREFDMDRLFLLFKVCFFIKKKNYFVLLMEIFELFRVNCFLGILFIFVYKFSGSINLSVFWLLCIVLIYWYFFFMLIIRKFEVESFFGYGFWGFIK